MTKRVSSLFKHRLTSIVLIIALLVVGALALRPVVGGRSDKQPPPQAQRTATTTVSNAQTCSQQLSLDFLVGQVQMVGLRAEDLGAQASLFQQYHLGGAVLMTSPSDPYDGSIKTFKHDSASSNVPPLISTDEEGGTVQRFTTLGTLPAAADVATSDSTASATKFIQQHAQKLKSVGIDMVLGPVADVAPAAADSPLGSRIFSSEPSVVRSYTRAYVQGWQAADILPTLKHFPGLGSATANTDYQSAVTPPFSELQGRDFIPYQDGMGATGTAVMIGNQNVPGWFTGPASLSPSVHTYLRSSLGFKDNLLVTDSLSAAAITNTTSEIHAITDAIAAGNDIALYVETSHDLSTNEALIRDSSAALKQAVEAGMISKQQLAASVSRKLSAQHIDPCSVQRISH